jgi:hypothetical protein
VPVFDPRRSTSRHDIGYNALACQALRRSGFGDPQRRTCKYTVGYGDDSTTVGDLISETLTFAGGAVRLPQLSIGCGHDNRGLFEAPAAGILGLGRGLMSSRTRSPALAITGASPTASSTSSPTQAALSPSHSPNSAPAPWTPTRRRHSPPQSAT